MMKRILSLCMAAALLFALAACGSREKSPEAPAAEEESVVESGEKVDGKRAESADDSAWARKLPSRSADAQRLLKRSRYAPDGTLLGWTEYSYDENGFLLREIPFDENGNVGGGDYTYIYDYEYVNGYLTAKDARSAGGTLVYRYKYDEAGREFKWILYAETGAVKLWYVDEFDERGSVTTHTLHTPGETPKLMNCREYDYDAYGNVLECRYLSRSGTVLSRYAYEYTYDDAGRVTECIQTDVSGNELVEWLAYAYDAQGRMVQKVQYDAEERPVIRNEYEYDAGGRLLWERIYSSAGELAVIVEYIWQ